MKEKILLAEDEVELAKAVKMILSFNDYDVTIVYNGEEAIEKIKQDVFSVIIMDIMMPVKDGITALKEMRKIGINTPIILLTAKSQIDDKVEGLDAGANDYLTKPFDKKELLARIRAAIRVNNDKKQIYNIGNVLFDKGASELSSSKAVFHLNNKESDILELLVKNRQKSMTANELERIIWNSKECVPSGVPMYISYLQNKFSALDANVFINDNDGYKLESKI